MRGRLLGTGLVGTLAAAFVVVAFPYDAALALQAYSAFLGVLAVVAIMNVLASVYPVARPHSAVDVVPDVDPLAAELARLLRQVELGTGRAGDLHAYLRPVLREIATRLLLSHGVDLDREPRRARELLGGETWELVRAERARPEQPLASGLSSNDLASVLTRLEAL